MRITSFQSRLRVRDGDLWIAFTIAHYPERTASPFKARGSEVLLSELVCCLTPIKLHGHSAGDEAAIFKARAATDGPGEREKVSGPKSALGP